MTNAWTDSGEFLGELMSAQAKATLHLTRAVEALGKEATDEDVRDEVNRAVADASGEIRTMRDLADRVTKKNAE